MHLNCVLLGPTRACDSLTGAANYKIQNGAPDKLELEIENMHLPSGWGAQLNFEDKRIKKISYTQNSLNSIQVSVHFMSAGQEYFSYVQNNPSAIIVRIWSQTDTAAKLASVEVKKTAIKKTTRSIARIVLSPKGEMKILETTFQ